MCTWKSNPIKTPMDGTLLNLPHVRWWIITNISTCTCVYLCSKKHFSLENLGQEIFILFYVNKITWTYQIDIYDNFSRKTRSNSCISKKNVAKWMLHNMMLGKILVTLTQSVSVCWPTVGAWCVGLWLTLGQ